MYRTGSREHVKTAFAKYGLSFRQLFADSQLVYCGRISKQILAREAEGRKIVQGFNGGSLLKAVCRMLGNHKSRSFNNTCTLNGVINSTGDLNGIHSRKNITVAVEGNIGSGKTTLLKYFRQNPTVEVVEEPVKKWQNVDGGNTLDLMYRDPKRWSYMFESYVLLTMMQIHQRPQVSQTRLIERSAYSAGYCFMEHQYRSGMITSVEYTIFQQWFQFLLEKQRPKLDLIVYLRTSPEKCMERIKKRSRNEESTVSMDLIQSLHDRYEDWLEHKTKFAIPVPVVTVDGDQSLEDLFQYYEANSKLLLGMTGTKLY